MELEDKNLNFPTFNTLDTKYGLNLLMGNEELYIKLLKGLHKYLEIDYHSLNDEDFKRSMHSLKSLSGSTGAHELSKLAYEIESTLNKDLLIKLINNLKLIIEEIDRNFSEKIFQKLELSIEIRYELFEKLREALGTKRAAICIPIIEEIEKYYLDEEYMILFNKIKEMVSDFKFKKALDYLNSQLPI